MNINQMFPGAYLKASDFPQPAMLQIASISMEKIGQGNEAEQKPVIHFAGVEQGLVLNKTNANIIVDSFGEETNNWIGQYLEIRSERVQFKDRMVDGIRLRAVQPQAQIASPFGTPAAPGTQPPGVPGMPQAAPVPPGVPQAAPVPPGVAPAKMPWEA